MQNAIISVERQKHRAYSLVLYTPAGKTWKETPQRAVEETKGQELEETGGSRTLYSSPRQIKKTEKEQTIVHSFSGNKY